VSSLNLTAKIELLFSLQRSLPCVRGADVRGWNWTGTYVNQRDEEIVSSPARPPTRDTLSKEKEAGEKRAAPLNQR
jgi:hypothetical protein